MSANLLASWAVLPVLLAIFVSLRRQNRPRFPPGPLGLPGLGNMLDMPTSMSWLTYQSWAKHYGDLIHMSMFGQHVIVINSAKVASDLIEKRSTKYSSRPTLAMIDMMGWDNSIGFLRYGEAWRRCRRLFHSLFKPTSLNAYQPTQKERSRLLLQDLNRNSKDLRRHTKNYVAGTVLSVTYGYDIQPKGDQILATCVEAVESLQNAFFPGAQLVNTFPILKNLPEWLPGTSFHQLAKEGRHLFSSMIEQPFAYVKQEIARDSTTPSLTRDLLSIPSNDPDYENFVKENVGLVFAVAIDTTGITLDTFFLLMTMYPEVQARAQAEIDFVIGDDRLPDFTDRDSLPFCEGLLYEVLRYNPAGPYGLPHCTTEDDVYEGYFIPKNSTILPNIWCMSHDENIFPDPDVIKPERWLKPDGSFDQTARATLPSFGFGRRSCPGRHLGESSVWLALTSVLQVFTISAPDGGKDLRKRPFREMFTDGMTSEPTKFSCDVAARKSHLLHQPT